MKKQKLKIFQIGNAYHIGYAFGSCGIRCLNIEDCEIICEALNNRIDGKDSRKPQGEICSICNGWHGGAIKLVHDDWKYCPHCGRELRPVQGA